MADKGTRTTSTATALELRLRSRPNKIARGMTRTSYRSNQVARMSDDAIHLSVAGTIDSLRPRFLYRTHRLPCACCGAKTGKWALNDRGRRQLARKRRYYAKGRKSNE